MKKLQSLSILALMIFSASALAQDGELPSDQLTATTLHLTGGIDKSDEPDTIRHIIHIWFIDGKRYDHNPFYLTALGHGYCALALNLSHEEFVNFDGSVDLAIQPASFVRKTHTGGFISVVKYPVQNGDLTCIAGVNTLSLKLKNIRYNLGNELVLGE